MSLNSTNSGASAWAITPNDSTDLVRSTRALYVGSAGDLKILLVDDTTPVTLVGVQAGTIYPLRIKRIYSAGTTAGSLIGFE